MRLLVLGVVALGCRGPASTGDGEHSEAVGRAAEEPGDSGSEERAASCDAEAPSWFGAFPTAAPAGISLRLAATATSVAAEALVRPEGGEGRCAAEAECIRKRREIGCGDSILRHEGPCTERSHLEGGWGFELALEIENTGTSPVVVPLVPGETLWVWWSAEPQPILRDHANPLYGCFAPDDLLAVKPGERTTVLLRTSWMGVEPLPAGPIWIKAILVPSGGRQGGDERIGLRLGARGDLPLESQHKPPREEGLELAQIRQWMMRHPNPCNDVCPMSTEPDWLCGADVTPAAPDDLVRMFGTARIWGRCFRGDHDFPYQCYPADHQPAVSNAVCVQVR